MRFLVRLLLWEMSVQLLITNNFAWQDWHSLSTSKHSQLSPFQTATKYRLRISPAWHLRGGAEHFTATKDENATHAMYSWNGKLYCLQMVCGQPDKFIDTSDGSCLWNRGQHTAGMLQHILAQASPTKRETPFTVHSAAVLPAEPLVPDLATRDGVEDTGKSDAEGSELDECDDEGAADNALEDTEEELQRTLDEVRLCAHG